MRFIKAVIPCIACLLLMLTSCDVFRKSHISRPDRNANTDKALIKKYEALIGTKIAIKSSSLALYYTVDAWMGVPYKYGGNTRQGTDCSGFTGCIYKEVYRIEIPRSSEDQFIKAQSVKKRNLEEGDLVFFRIQEKKKASHVGLYLGNNKFIHASTKKGVRIDDLEDDYYKKYYAGAGRFK